MNQTLTKCHSFLFFPSLMHFRYYACLCGHEDVVEFLLQNGKNYSCLAFIWEFHCLDYGTVKKFSLFLSLVAFSLIFFNHFERFFHACGFAKLFLALLVLP